jgi:PAS domain S-box-containing protein
MDGMPTDTQLYRPHCGFAILEVLRDARGDAVDCEFKAVNTAFEELMGLTAGEVAGRMLTDIVPESNAEWVNFCGRIASGNLRAKFKTFFPRIGKRLEVVLYGHAEGQVGALIIDITLGRSTQAELQQNEEGFRSIAENAPEGIFIAPGFDGPFLYANRCASELTGYAIDELRQIGPAQLVPLDDYPRIKQRMEQRLRGEKVQETYRTNLLRKDGQVTPVEVTGSRVVWRGRPAVLTRMRDVSRYVFKEEELEQWALGFKAEWQDAVRALELKKAELSAQKMSLDRTSREVAKTNTALSVLARNIDRRREELEKKIAHAVSAKIMPVMNELRSDKLPVKSLAKVDVLSALLADLTPEGSKAHEVIAVLSTTEMRLALMIKKDFTSEQIAGLLNMSPHTIKTHRRNIRKKLGLQNSKVNLSSYLKLKFSKDSPLFLKDGTMPSQDKEIKE